MVMFMKNYDLVIDLLNEKREIFLEVEKLTNLMLISPIEELSEILEERGEFLQKAVLIENEINNKVSSDECARSILSNSGDMSNLPCDLEKLYESSMRIKAVINRINNLEVEVQERFESERDLILEKIESMNSSSNSVAGNYKRTVQMGFPQISLLDKEKSI